MLPTPPSPEPKKLEEIKKADDKKGDDKKAEPPTPLEQAAQKLFIFQQQLAARVRVLDEREEKVKLLLAALDELEKKATAYSTTLEDTRRLALQLNAVALAIKTRVGRGDFEPGKIPAGITDALAGEARTKLDGASTTVLNVLTQLRQERDTLRKPDPDADNLKALTKELLDLVGQRIDLLADLKKLAADYAIPRKDRPTSEQKRLDQLAAERLDKEDGRWDWFFALDKSKSATNLSDLLDTYYKELIDLDEKEENLKKQKEKIEKLVELTQKESAAIMKGQPLLEKQLTKLADLRERDTILVRARFKPEQAEELLKAYQTKTGLVLPKPV
ncbi:MAG: hypothetical protein L0241_28530, partial [Planctomycetia bacterium]|nr:hypothetical protein [Planctomycetia bacterium]